MKRIFRFCLPVAAMLTATCLSVPSAWAQVPSPAPKLAIGAFGGLALPIVQDDQKQGSVFGFYGRIKLIPFLVVEPNISFVKYGDPDPVSGVNLGIAGSKLTSFGLDVTLGGAPGGVGLSPFFHAGAATYKIKNDDTGFDQSRLGFSGGPGLLVQLGPIDLDARGKVVIIPLDGGGSKKSVTATVGLSYVLGI